MAADYFHWKALWEMWWEVCNFWLLCASLYPWVNLWLMQLWVLSGLMFYQWDFPFILLLKRVYTEREWWRLGMTASILLICSFCSSCRLLDLMHNTWWWQILKLWNAKFVLGHNLNRTCHSQWCQYDGDYSFKVCWLWKRSCICTSLQWKHLLKYSLLLLKKKIGLN